MAKILYVEDNEDNVYMLQRRLERAGFKIVVAPDGEQGLAVAHDQRPDVILMDLSLPVLDGWQATRRPKDSEETRNSGHRLVRARHAGRPGLAHARLPSGATAAAARSRRTLSFLKLVEQCLRRIEIGGVLSTVLR